MEPILIVEDEAAIVAVIRDRLQREGFGVRCAATGEDALAQLAEIRPRLVVLDIMLPGIDGFEVLRRLRESGDRVPVIVLTARDEDVDRIVGLEMGADDYIAKPFNPRELSARIRAVLRRSIPPPPEAPSAQPHQCPGTRPRLRFDDVRRRATLDGVRLQLRPREYDLLRFLERNRGQVFSRDALLDRVWGTASFIGSRTVDVHIRRLRQKLAAVDPDEEFILTEWGVGYSLAEDL